MLTNNHILTIQAELEKNRAGFRKQSGTMLRNDRTGETVYTPPQHTDDIIRLMSRLEAFINDDNTEKLSTRLSAWRCSITSLKAFTRFTTATAEQAGLSMCCIWF